MGDAVTPTVRHRQDTGELTADAGNRALRTFLQGAAYTIALAVGLVLYNAFQAANGWGSFDWSALGFAAVQAAVTAGFAYVMRAKLDASSVPTPLPPPTPPPNDDEPHRVMDPGEAATLTALSHLDAHGDRPMPTTHPADDEYDPGDYDDPPPPPTRPIA
jgi:hypothetical protein